MGKHSGRVFDGKQNVHSGCAENKTSPSGYAGKGRKYPRYHPYYRKPRPWAHLKQSLSRRVTAPGRASLTNGVSPCGDCAISFTRPAVGGIKLRRQGETLRRRRAARSQPGRAGLLPAPRLRRSSLNTRPASPGKPCHGVSLRFGLIITPISSERKGIHSFFTIVRRVSQSKAAVQFCPARATHVMFAESSCRSATTAPRIR